MRKSIKVYLEESEVEHLDRLASAKGSSRSDYARSRLLFGTDTKSFTPTDYYQLVSDCCRRSNMPRSAVERVVEHVFTALMAPPN